MRSLGARFVALSLVLAGCFPRAPSPPSLPASASAALSPSPSTPRTVVLVSLDDFRADYLDRLGAVLLRALAWRARAAGNPRSLAGGSHGYDNALRSMGALFVAAGPAFREGVRARRFGNVHVYALLADLLELTPAPTDGSLDSVRTLLR